jgi:hypothetical protein
VDEEGVTARDIAHVIGQGLSVPTVSVPAGEMQAHFGWLGMFASLDMPASSTWTQKQLGWQPKGPGLLADLQATDYGAI